MHGTNIGQMTVDWIGSSEELCAMNALKQVMDRYEENRSTSGHPVDQETTRRIAHWFASSYSSGVVDYERIRDGTIQEKA